MTKFSSSDTRTILIVVLVCLQGIAAAQSSGSPRPPVAESKFRIAGTVVNVVTGHPLARVHVSVADTKNRQNAISTFSSDDGRFEFNQLPAGKYALEGTKRGFINSAYERHGEFSTAIVTGAGVDTEHLTLRMPPFAVLAGKVLDESGEPVRNATVTIYRENNRSGVSRIQPLRAVTTDDQGSFEIMPMVAGTYFVSVKATPWYAMHAASPSQQNPEVLPSFVERSLDVAYPVTYYNDATDSESATPIPIRDGDHVEVEVRLSPVPALRIVFRASEASENSNPMPVLLQPAFDGVAAVYGSSIQAVSPGVYEMTGIAAGKYTIRMRGDANSAEWSEVDLTTDGQELETSNAESTSSVKASIHVLGEDKLPPGLGVALQNAKRRIVAWQEVSEKGDLEFNNVSPGKYQVLAASTDKAYSVVRITTTAGETSGHQLDVPAGGALTVSLSLVGGTSNVEGFARRGGKPVAGAMIVLVPKNPEVNRDLFRRDQSDLDGSFHLADVIPGTYTVIAIEDGWDLDWAQPGVIANYAKHGQSISIGGGTRGSVRLRDFVDVQSR